MAKLSQLDSPYAKAFYLIQEFQTYQYITESEKFHIKDLIIKNDPSVYNLLLSKNDYDFKENLLKLIKKIRLQIDQQSEVDEVSTSKSLKLFLRLKLKLNLKNSNFNLAMNKG
ncbi:unnamed protein product [Paramecium sonneborni]|uniref:Uncharacterized protein n=1 Tax=Paramecium sonneborni TaxID=65129 RepID=A0A8S1P8G4_9CILI|nr:unnamed protein product [Paramecium sonneborni]